MLAETEEDRITMAEMKFMRRTVGVTLRERVRSEIITSEPGVTLIMKKNQVLQKKLKKTMEEYRSLKQVLQCTHSGRESIGIPRKYSSIAQTNLRQVPLLSRQAKLINLGMNKTKMKFPKSAFKYAIKKKILK